MGFRHLLTIPAEIHLRIEGELDAYGHPEVGWSVLHTECWINQTRRTEYSANEVDYERFQAFFPAGTSLPPTAKVVVRGVEYQVHGPSWDVVDPRAGAVHHVEATLVRTS